VLVGIVEFLGWFGAVTVLAGYLLFSLGKIPNGPLYQLLNLVGGLSVAINVAAHHAIPSTIVNGIWAVVAVVVLVKMTRTRCAAKRHVVEAPVPAALHTEPPATTAVLPIVGPALRDHDADLTGTDPAAPRLPAGTAVRQGDAAVHVVGGAHAPGSVDHTAGAADVAPAAPLTESIPVITATIALALVAAAQERAETVTARDGDQHDGDPLAHAEVPTAQ